MCGSHRIAVIIEDGDVAHNWWSGYCFVILSVMNASTALSTSVTSYPAISAS
jgi:hypothetical protein